jgi:hypothetical protein
MLLHSNRGRMLPEALKQSNNPNKAGSKYEAGVAYRSPFKYRILEELAVANLVMINENFDLSYTTYHASSRLH